MTKDVFSLNRLKAWSKASRLFPRIITCAGTYWSGSVKETRRHLNAAPFRRVPFLSWNVHSAMRGRKQPTAHDPSFDDLPFNSFNFREAGCATPPSLSPAVIAEQDMQTIWISWRCPTPGTKKGYGGESSSSTPPFIINKKLWPHTPTPHIKFSGSLSHWQYEKFKKCIEFRVRVLWVSKVWGPKGVGRSFALGTEPTSRS